jgi:hypothetical protein
LHNDLQKNDNKKWIFLRGTSQNSQKIFQHFINSMIDRNAKGYEPDKTTTIESMASELL